MVAFRGRLFCGTLPSGTVHSMAAGLVVSPGLAVADDGFPVDRRTAGRDLASAGIATASPLILGGGPRASFEGELAGVRLFGRALAAEEVAFDAGRWPS